MARKPDIQYIHQFYVPGSDAKVVELKPKKQRRKAKTVLPKAAPNQKIVYRVDRMALCGIVVAAVMLILLAVGTVQYLNVCQQHRDLSDQVIKLQNQNVTLREEYRAGYDLEEIRIVAQALGMVPVEELQTVKVSVKVPTPVPEPTLWENIVWFFDGLFA